MPNKTNEINGNLITNSPNDTEKQRVKLDSPGVAKLLSKRIKDDIDAYCARVYDDGHRNHLGASLIGDECKRKLWYSFRWVKHELHTGRQQRLFNRGHREEARFIEWLEGIGFKVWFENRDLPKKEDGTYPQYRISGAQGHFGGSLDGIGQFPEAYQIDEPILLEFKTNGTGKGFSDLTASGMAIAKPQHFAQTSTYGEDYKFNWVLYLNICKNDDDIHVELVRLNHELGAQMKEKAERIIFSQEPPPRIAANPTFQSCKWCHFKDICHTGATPEKNCRSCRNASPAANGEWHCSVHNGIIPQDFIKIGCPQYTAITQNVI